MKNPQRGHRLTEDIIDCFLHFHISLSTLLSAQGLARCTSISLKSGSKALQYLSHCGNEIKVRH